MTELERRIGYRFRRRALFEEALRHASAAERKPGTGSYQRLEFLGDAVLNLCVAEEMFLRNTEAGEGTLSRARSAVINNRSLVRVGDRIKIARFLAIDPSVKTRGGGVTRKMVADAVEALSGAIFLDGGYQAARAFVLSHFFKGKQGDEDTDDVFDPKSRLQEWCQAKGYPLPQYRLVGEAGPPHARRFTSRCRAGGRYEANGTGRTKKEAEQEAAAAILRTIDSEGEAG